MKRVLKLVLIDLIVSLVYSLFCGFKGYSFINCSFTVGMFLLFAGAMCFVWEKGFFDIPLYSFNKFAQSFRKKKGFMVDEESLTLDDFVLGKHNFAYTNPLLFSGIIISVTTFVLSYIVYAI
ncbi:MAG: DUF3899 domain-containing protein [Clostridioides sp.]|nr:DUF3899 domain-containing protein [Clostridioides sp.]